MRAALKVAICLAFVSASCRVAGCQSYPIAPTDPYVQGGITDARTIINNITVTPGQPGWLGKLARKIQMSLCLRNFEKMLKAGKVKANDPRAPGAMAGTTPEAQRNEQHVRTTGVGVGDEEILLGPSVTAIHPVERGQKFIHEGARVKERIETTIPALLPNNGGPGPNAPPGERCRWLQHEYEVYDTDADYYQEAAAQAQAQNAPAGVVQALNLNSQQRRDKANSIKREIERNC